VTVEGQTSDPFQLSVRAPYKLTYVDTINRGNSTWAYETEISYTIRDQFNALLPPGSIPVNEKWTTAIEEDYTDMDWRRGSEKHFTLPQPALSDIIQGELSGRYPTPQSPGSAGAVKVYHWGQAIFVGSTTVGLGRRVQTDTLQKYSDRAAHENVTSPNPN
jgi:hypothetical protein